MIYKKYELSKSLNGEDIITIARNYAGNVIFRGPSDEAVISMIDDAILEKERLEKEKEELKLKKEKDKEKKKKRGLFQAPPDEKDEEDAETEIKKEENEAIDPPHQRVTRGPDGKFISKSKLQEQEREKEEDENKKGFWAKLTS